MPVLSKPDLMRRVIGGLQEGGWSVIYETSPVEHPMLVTIVNGDRIIKLLVYIWNLTHGGGPARPTNEMRIQITGISPPLQMIPGRATLVLGWLEDLGVFAAFDPLRHMTFSTQSPSIQINRHNLESVRSGGMSFYKRGNGELAVAISRDLLGAYAAEQRRLHDYGDNAGQVAVLEAAGVAETLPADELDKLPLDRQQVVTTVSRLARDSTFRQRVLSAYGHSCAMCESQLELAQAAHIVPVPVPGSTDETSNGLALCPDHHLGYDRAMIAVMPDYRIVVSEGQANRLAEIGLAGGIERFRAVRTDIHLPLAVLDRPKQEYLQRAIEVRKFGN